MGNARLLDDRPGDGDHPSHPNGARQHASLDRQTKRAFAVIWLFVALVFSIAGNIIGGKSEVVRALLALGCSSPGAYASLLLGLRARTFAPEKRVVLLAAGSVVRLLSTLLLSALVWCVILSTPTAGFWLWVVIGYGLTLAVDVWLMLRALQATS